MKRIFIYQPTGGILHVNGSPFSPERGHEMFANLAKMT